MAEFSTQRDIKATRKEHRCGACTKLIPIGSRAFYFSGKWEGYFSTCYYHTECRDAEVALNDLRETYPGEWDPIGDIAEEPEDVEWLVDNHPVVAARLGLLPTGED